MGARERCFFGKYRREEDEETMSLNPEIDLVFAHNDRMAKGVYKVVKVMGKEKEISFVRIGGLAGEGCDVDMILSDKLLASFVNVIGGGKIVELPKGEKLVLNILIDKCIVEV